MSTPTPPWAETHAPLTYEAAKTVWPSSQTLEQVGTCGPHEHRDSGAMRKRANAPKYDAAQRNAQKP